MPDSERINRINLLLRRRQGVTMAELTDVLEASRATINRDLQYMRDRLNAPIVWDRASGSYRLGNNPEVGPSYQVPGLWLTPAQAYAYLTLNNMVEKFAPALLGSFIEPMRGTLKQLLCEADFPMYGLDRKIEIQMPAMPDLDERTFGHLMQALLEGKPVHIELMHGKEIDGVPQKLAVSADSWTIHIVDGAGVEHSMDVAAILSILPFAKRPEVC